METILQGSCIHYEVYPSANAKAPVVLLLHGWGCDSTMFSFVADALTQDYTVLQLDFPGHGKSKEPPLPWAVTDYANMVIALLDMLEIPEVQIVAHSFGGRVAIVLASEFPTRVKKMVITGGAGIRKPVSAKQSKRTMRFKRYTKLLNRLKTIPGFSALAEKCQEKLRKRYGSPDYNKLSEEMRKTFVKVISEDLSPRLSKTQAPTLLIWGSSDTETPLWMGQEMEKNIPDAGLVVFEGRGHFAFLDEGQRFTLIVKEFFSDRKG